MSKTSPADWLIDWLEKSDDVTFELEILCGASAVWPQAFIVRGKQFQFWRFSCVKLFFFCCYRMSGFSKEGFGIGMTDSVSTGWDADDGISGIHWQASEAAEPGRTESSHSIPAGTQLIKSVLQAHGICKSTHFTSFLRQRWSYMCITTNTILASLDFGHVTFWQDVYLTA